MLVTTVAFAVLVIVVRGDVLTLPLSLEFSGKSGVFSL